MSARKKAIRKKQIPVKYSDYIVTVPKRQNKIDKTVNNQPANESSNKTDETQPELINDIEKKIYNIQTLENTGKENVVEQLDKSQESTRSCKQGKHVYSGEVNVREDHKIGIKRPRDGVFEQKNRRGNRKKRTRPGLEKEVGGCNDDVIEMVFDESENDQCIFKERERNREMDDVHIYDGSSTTEIQVPLSDFPGDKTKSNGSDIECCDEPDSKVYKSSKWDKSYANYDKWQDLENQFRGDKAEEIKNIEDNVMQNGVEMFDSGQSQNPQKSGFTQDKPLYSNEVKVCKHPRSNIKRQTDDGSEKKKEMRGNRKQRRLCSNLKNEIGGSKDNLIEIGLHESDTDQYDCNMRERKKTWGDVHMFERSTRPEMKLPLQESPGNGNEDKDNQMDECNKENNSDQLENTYCTFDTGDDKIRHRKNQLGIDKEQESTDSENGTETSFDVDDGDLFFNSLNSSCKQEGSSYSDEVGNCKDHWGKLKRSGVEGYEQKNKNVHRIQRPYPIFEKEIVSSEDDVIESAEHHGGRNEKGRYGKRYEDPTKSNKMKCHQPDFPADDKEVKGSQIDDCGDENDSVEEDNNYDTFDGSDAKKYNKDRDERHEVYGIRKYFDFKIPYKEWMQLPIVNTTTYRRLGGNWTDTFATHFNSINPNCVLAFKYNRIARSQKATDFGSFSANCKHKNCSAVYKMTISEAPLDNEDTIVHVHREGDISFKNETRSRFLKGSRRREAGEKLNTRTPFMYRSELIIEADTKQLKAGNQTSVPSKEVLKQVRAEERQYEKLSDCVIREINATKRTLEMLDKSTKSTKGYIQYIGYEPFFIINYCSEQIDVLSESCQSGNSFLYFDATGLSMKRPMDQTKRLYMYCLVLKTAVHTEGIRVAEMITNDHTTPSITNFLMRIRHSLTSNRKYHPPRKIETDYSFAMIHASCRAFNSCDIIHYLKECWKCTIETTSLRNDMTVLHICAAHMLKTFQRMIASSTDNKSKRRFWLYVLARLQTAQFIDQITSLVQDVATVCTNKSRDKNVDSALNRIKAAVQKQETIQHDFENNIPYDETLETHQASLRRQSPYYQYYSQIIDNTYIARETEHENEYYNPIIISKLLKDYLPFLPLWSGMFVSEPGRNVNEGSSRDTNAVVERQFATVKNEILQKERNVNPGKACRLLYIAATGMSKLASVSSKKSKITDDVQEEERWERRGKPNTVKKKKSKYFSTPSEKEFINITKDENKPRSVTKKLKNPDKKERTEPRSGTLLQDKSVPRTFKFNDDHAMKWGGVDITGIALSNTCTIDNILTAIYVIVCSRPDIRQMLSQSKDTAIQVVLEICLNEMAQKKWTEAKIKFVNDILQKHGSAINLFGTEFEMAVKHLVKPQTHTTNTYCLECYEGRSARFDLLELGMGRNMLNSIHDLIYDWESGFAYHCPAGCGGITSTFHNFESLPALLFVAIDLVSTEGRLNNDTLNEPISIVGQTYDLYAATLNSHGHFRLLIRSSICGTWYEYDGLRASQRYIEIGDFRCKKEETIVHLIYVKRHTK